MKKLTLQTLLMTALLLGSSFVMIVRAVPPPLPDFVIESMSISPTNAVEGTPITVTVTVKNQGQVAGDGRYLDLWYAATNSLPGFGDVGDWWTPVGSLEAGASRTITAPSHIVDSFGMNQLFACIEFENIVSETSNTNNCSRLTFETLPIETLLVPVYRFWSPVYRGHFFTISESEKDSIIANLSHDWGYEGIAYYTFSGATIYTVPVYRFWSSRYKGHFFTISEAEKNNIIANLSADWSYEGVAYYVYSSSVPDSTPVYRFWSPRYKHHFFTNSEAEKNTLIANLSADWSYEGIAYYVPTLQVEIGVDLTPSGIPVVWMQSYGLKVDGSDDNDDIDGDGLTARQEWIADTNPTNRQSVLRFESVVRPVSDVGYLLRWQSVITRKYDVERATNLVIENAFQPIATGIQGEEGHTEYQDNMGEQPGSFFYRVGVQTPSP